MHRLSVRLCFLVIVIAVGDVVAQSKPCAARTYSSGHTVCVCNATYCDVVEPLGSVVAGSAVLFTTTKAGKRLQRSTVAAASSTPKGATTLQLDTSKKMQTVMGFGAAFTDSAGINLKSLPGPMQDTILSQYFSPDGHGYTIGRVPMASCDFSTHEYSYDDVPLDFNWNNFSLKMEDFNYKIPYIKKAMDMASNKLRLFSSPWSAPGWMKASGRMKGGGPLLGDTHGPYHTAWANYFVKFFEAYHEQGIDFWGVTVQNEPSTGLDPDFMWQTMYFTAAMERDFVKQHLGPTLKASPLTKNLKLMINDDQRTNLPIWPDTILNDPAAAQYVSGIAMHWYQDKEIPASILSVVHSRHPDYFILATEACTGFLPPEQKPLLGDWGRAQEYAKDIIEDMENWVAGWVDWNIALDLQGGPNWVNNFVDAAIIVNATATEFYKQPMWHVMGHFSRFIPVGSVRVSHTMTTNTNVESVAFANQDSTRTVVLLNKNDKTSEVVSISDVANPNVVYSVTLEPSSIISLIFK